ncbi:MAG: efflux RND transporter periplasmic adaptor subunit [Acidovorax sp.]|jgi:RND family efflux transporter MFP subunit|uniref:efflux RND transporter periplasmic adaptor subunit n=1 Tax=Acidovorax sp. TaxID=1872122 RepID=UPI0026058CD4|nr:efflux RND transporter periplasmic adaptor subunit [Acidovorax sp.]MDH4465964.1 efflux RND transporter periplasmic adaptor subunit [Acidovorax sp.]
MKRWTFWAAAAVVVLLVGAGFWKAQAARQSQQKAAAAAALARAQAPLELVAADVFTVRQQRIALGVPVSGALRAVDSAMLKARAAGELQGLVLREGDRVRAGDIVARIDPTEAQARLRQAQQQADAARAQVDINQRQLNNNKALVDQGFISATALVTSQASLESAQASHRAALAAADIARKGLEDTVIRSPIAGLVAQRLAQPGERVAIDARVIEVVDLSKMELEALLSPADSVRVQVGQTALLTIEGASEPVKATVARISPSAQAVNRTVPTYLRVDAMASGLALRQGLFVQGILNTGMTDALVVPLNAVRTDKPAPYVQVIRQGQITHVPVRTGTRSRMGEETVVAVEGLEREQQILAGHIGLLREGTAVTVVGTAPASAQPAK